MCCRRSEPRPPRTERGAALVLAMLVFALAVALMVGLQRDFTLMLQRGSNTIAGEQAWAYLRGAEALAAIALAFDADQDAGQENPRDDLGEVWATPGTPYPLDDGGLLVGNLEDLQGRFNVNLLAEGADSDGEPVVGEARLTAPQQQFVRLLQSLEGVALERSEAIALTEAIADFIDQDDQRRVQGAEDGAYRGLQPAYRPANQPLASISELRAVSGMSQALYQALLPWVSVWPAGQARLNILTAPLPVLRTLNVDGRLDPMPLEEAQRLFELRADGEIQDVDTLLADTFFTDGDTSQLRPFLGQSSSWFLLEASLEFADRELRLYSVLERSGRDSFSRLRTLGAL